MREPKRSAGACGCLVPVSTLAVSVQHEDELLRTDRRAREHMDLCAGDPVAVPIAQAADDLGLLACLDPCRRRENRFSVPTALARSFEARPHSGHDAKREA